jgi:hypothetical protein
MRAWVPLTHLPSGWTEPLGPTASEVLPSDNIPPNFSHRRRGIRWLWRYRVGRRGCHRPHCRAVSWNRSGRRHRRFCRRTISPPHFSHRRRGMQWLWRYRVGRRGCHRPHCRAVSWNRSGRRHQSRSRRTISPPLGGEEYLYSPIGVCAGGEYDGFGATG